MFTKRGSGAPASPGVPSASGLRKMFASTAPRSATPPRPLLDSDALSDSFARAHALLSEVQALVRLGVSPQEDLRELKDQLQMLDQHVQQVPPTQRAAWDARFEALKGAVVQELRTVSGKHETVLSPSSPSLAAPSSPSSPPAQSTLFDGLMLSPAPVSSPPLFSGLSFGTPTTPGPRPGPLFQGLSLGAEPTPPPAPSPLPDLFTLSPGVQLAQPMDLFGAEPPTFTQHAMALALAPQEEGLDHSVDFQAAEELQVPALAPVVPLAEASRAAVPPGVSAPGTLEQAKRAFKACLADTAVRMSCAQEAARKRLLSRHAALRQFACAAQELAAHQQEQERLCSAEDFAGADAQNESITRLQHALDLARAARAEAEGASRTAEAAVLVVAAEELAEWEEAIVRVDMLAVAPADVRRRTEAELAQLAAEGLAAEARDAELRATQSAELAQLQGLHAAALGECATLRAALEAAEARLAAADAALGAHEQAAQAAAMSHAVRLELLASRTACLEGALEAAGPYDAEREARDVEAECSGAVEAAALAVRMRAELARRTERLEGRRSLAATLHTLMQAEQAAQTAQSRARHELGAAERAALQAASARSEVAQSSLLAEERLASAGRQVALLEERKRGAVAAKDFKAAASVAADAKAVAAEREGAEQLCSLLRAQESAAQASSSAANAALSLASARLDECCAAAAQARLEVLQAECGAAERAVLRAMEQEQFQEADALQSALDALAAEVVQLRAGLS